ncbi:MAG TPA: hypothetical protein VEY67_00420 [Candidatus Dormibacteraeota bacterium]|nr:hypothetical protein [Candidatus Dormibacteraeota bacterium]
MTTAVEPYVLTIEDEQLPVLANSDDVERSLLGRLAVAASIPTRVLLRDPSDTEGHRLETDVAVVLQIGDDVEGHAFSLRFPNAGAAREFEKRILTAGLLTGVIAAGVVGVGIGPSVQRATAPATANAPVAWTVSRDMDKALATSVTATARDLDRELAAPAAATRDLDKSLAVSGAPASSTRDLDRELAAPAAATRDLDKSLAVSGAPASSTRDLDRELAAPAAATRDMDKELASSARTAGFGQSQTAE